MTPTEALKRARRGAKFLDRRVPGWARRVRITKLDMSCAYVDERGCGCIIAQLSEGRGYTNTLVALGINLKENQDDTLGFDTNDYDYEGLTEAWRTVIRDRRAKSHAAA